jgi:hypothetical protein
MGGDTKEAIIKLFNDEIAKIRTTVIKVLFTFGLAIILMGIGYGKILSDLVHIKEDIQTIKNEEYLSFETYSMLRAADLEWRENQKEINDDIIEMINKFNDKVYENRPRLRGSKIIDEK